MVRDVELAYTLLIGSPTTEDATKLMRMLRRLVRSTTGQDLIEYALLAGLISVGVVLVLGPLGVSVSSSYQRIDAALSAPGAPGNNGGGNNGGGNNGGGNNGGGNNGGGNNGGGNNGRGNGGGQ